MIERPRCARLPDGQRLHLRHGPIDIVLRAHGVPDAVRDAEHAAIRRFRTILEEVCGELEYLRRRPAEESATPQGAVARRMLDAVSLFATRIFITPMAAVAGAVADEILAAMISAAPLDKAFVNNGGDIALHLSDHASMSAAIVDRIGSPRVAGLARIHGTGPVRGIATSGWGGRSFSLGIADAVTVLATQAAAADAAATLIANAVDLPGHAAIRRCPATALKPDSDLGAMPVTIGVARLAQADIAAALHNGLNVAERMQAEGHIVAAALFLQGVCVTTRRFPMIEKAGAREAERPVAWQARRMPAQASHHA
jgi:ApbE superfamily uncharacterized protein (UPF0280 family)